MSHTPQEIVLVQSGEEYWRCSGCGRTIREDRLDEECVLGVHVEDALGVDDVFGGDENSPADAA